MLAALAVQPVLDRLDIHEEFLLFGALDWVGHLATGVVIVGLLRPPRRMAVAILAASLLIDLDHLPAELGTDVLTAGTPRPYTHSLATLVVLLAVAAATRSQLMLGAAIGVAGHLVRDVGTGDGVSLLWPLTDAEANVPFVVYAVVLAVTAARAAAIPTAPRRPPR